MTRREQGPAGRARLDAGARARPLGAGAATHGRRGAACSAPVQRRARGGRALGRAHGPRGRRRGGARRAGAVARAHAGPRPGRRARRHRARRGGRRHRGGARPRRARPHVARRLRLEGLVARGRQHRHQRRRREGHPLRAHARWVLGLEVVLASGELLRPGGALEKNNTGVDLRSSSSAARARSASSPPRRSSSRACPAARRRALSRPELGRRARALSPRAGAAPFTLSAFEFFTDRCLARVLRHRKVTQPFAERSRGPCTTSWSRSSAPATASGEPFDAWLASLARRARRRRRDGAELDQAAQLWSLRESISESLSATGLPHKNDIALPIAALEPFCAASSAHRKSATPAGRCASSATSATATCTST
jgi:hypothetical protein